MVKEKSKHLLKHTKHKIIIIIAIITWTKVFFTSVAVEEKNEFKKAQTK